MDENFELLIEVFQDNHLTSLTIAKHKERSLFSWLLFDTKYALGAKKTMKKYTTNQRLLDHQMVRSLQLLLGNILKIILACKITGAP